MRFDITIDGETLEVHVLTFQRGCDPYTSGHPDNWDPGCPDLVEFELRDSDGWLVVTNNYLTEVCEADIYNYMNDI